MRLRFSLARAITEQSVGGSSALLAIFSLVIQMLQLRSEKVPTALTKASLTSLTLRDERVFRRDRISVGGTALRGIVSREVRSPGKPPYRGSVVNQPLDTLTLLSLFSNREEEEPLVPSGHVTLT